MLASSTLAPGVCAVGTGERVIFRLNMISLASGRRMFYGVPVWRCLQQITRVPNCTTKTQLLLHTQASSVFMSFRPASTSRLLSIKPLSWHVSYLCHGNSRGTSERGDNKEGFSLRALTKAPKPAVYLGFSSLIPFLSAPLLMAVTQSFYPEVAYAQVV